MEINNLFNKQGHEFVDALINIFDVESSQCFSSRVGVGCHTDYKRRREHMGALEIGQKMVTMVSGGRESEQAFVTQYYDNAIVSIEGGTGDMPQKMEGIDAIRSKHDWWYDNNEVHNTQAIGPYVGHRADQFIVRFMMDITPKDGARMTMEEVAIYTVAGEKIVQEEYLYLMG